jgi:hypothetical protein
MKMSGKSQLDNGESPERLVGPRVDLQLSLPGVEDRKIIVNFKLRIGTFSPQKNAIKRSWMPRILRSTSATARLLVLRVRWHGCVSLVNVVCCVSRGLCDGPIPRPGESRRIFVCVIECDQKRQSLSAPTIRRLKVPNLKKRMSLME